MCGISGILNLWKNPAPSRQELSSMISMLNHRGPDDTGFYTDHQIGMAHARLSIIDLNGGHQPMSDRDKKIWLVFNGEIFNFIELRSDLEKDGAVFRTESDTEVIIHLYRKYGPSFVNCLNGQFAIALWDCSLNRLILVRDRAGIIPLFYFNDGKRLIFASEVKSILTTLKRSPSLNPQALDQLLTFWSPVASNTLFKDIFEVEPGQLMQVDNGRVSLRRYWSWAFPEHASGDYLPGTVAQLSEQLHDKLVQATQIRLRSDVPVGAYLSGGLDSSALVSIIHHHGNVPLRTFSIGFDDKGLDESSYQRQLIQHLSSEHSRIQCSSENIAESFQKAIWHTESAILRSAPIPMMLLSGLVHQHQYKVVLTGEGADEVFGGYDIFKEGKIRQFWAINKGSAFRPLILKRLYPYLDITQSNSRAYLEAFFGNGLDNPVLPYFAHLPRWDTTSKIKAFYSDDMKATLNSSAIDDIQSSLPEEIDSWHPFNRSQYIEARSLMAKYLLCSQGDRMLMANSVEGRFPFLDHHIIEFANRLDPRMKMKVLNEKFLLKESMKRYVPKEIINRHKQPYRAPDITAFINDKTPDFVNDLLSEHEIKEAGYFDPKRTSVLMRKIRAGRATGYKDNMAFMALLSTQMWHHLFIKEPYTMH